MGKMFALLYANMSVIAPTGNTYEEDFAYWSTCMTPVLEEGRSSVILLLHEDELCGYFQYSINNDTFMMEEIQFGPAYQGSGMFHELYRYLTSVVPIETKYVEAYANKKNEKSQGVLKHLGLKVIGENKNGKSYHFRGDYQKLYERYSK